jgi:hypothetical protein
MTILGDEALIRQFLGDIAPDPREDHDDTQMTADHDDTQMTDDDCAALVAWVEGGTL